MLDNISLLCYEEDTTRRERNEERRKKGITSFERTETLFLEINSTKEINFITRLEEQRNPRCYISYLINARLFTMIAFETKIHNKRYL